MIARASVHLTEPTTSRSRRSSSRSARSGLLVRRNVLVMFMCVELMLNAVNLTFVDFAKTLDDISGQAIVFFVLVVAAAEVAVGLAIIVAIFRRRRSGATADDIDLLQRLTWRMHGGSQVSARDLLDTGVARASCCRCSGAVLLLLAGKRIGEPKAGWIATTLLALAFVWSVVMLDRAAVACPATSARNIGEPLHLVPGRQPEGEHRVPHRPALGHLDPAGHRRRLADPPLRDRVHARRRALHPVLRLPQPVRRLDAHPGPAAAASSSPSSGGRASASAPTC